MSLTFLDDRAGRISASMLGAWRRCRTAWALHYLAPHPEATPDRAHKGILPRRTASPLLVGIAFHKFAEAWYHTRCRTGEDNGAADLEAALHEADTVFLARRDEFEDEATWENDRALVRRLAVRYHDHYGPKGLAPEFPRMRVLFDTKGPMIERAHEFQLGGTEGVKGYGTYTPGIGKYIYHCRTDLFVEDTEAGLSYARDFKTTGALWRRVGELDMDAQLTGEMWVLDKVVGTARVAGVEAVLVNKRPAMKPTPSSPPEFHVHRTYRTPADLEKWRRDTVGTMQEIEDHVFAYESSLLAGVDPWVALREVFAMSGTSTGACLNTYGRACEYLSLDQNLGAEEREVLAYRPRPASPLEIGEEGE